MCCGGGDISETANRLGLPEELLAESETLKIADGMYPDTVQAVGIFADMMTQWRFGAAGPTGLDYTALPIVLDMRQVERTAWSEIFDDVRIMERAALKAMRERR